MKSKQQSKQISPQQLEIFKCKKRLMRNIGNAIEKYNLIRDGDRVMVGVSGGKDSLTTLQLLHELSKRSPITFTVTAGHIALGKTTGNVLSKYFNNLGIEYIVDERDFESIMNDIADPRKNKCSLCARFRRAALYDQAVKLDCQVIALGHHSDDLIETLLMSILYSGQIKSMPARLVSDSKEHIVIRPLCLAREEDIAKYARLLGLPVVENIECNEKGDTKRKYIKDLLAQLQKDNTAVKGNALNSLQNVVTSHILDLEQAIVLKQVGERNVQ